MGVVNHRRHTNKHFKDNLVTLASKDTQKGHLTKQKRDADDNQTVTGILKHIIIDRIESNGWMVEVGTGKDTSLYACTNPEPYLTLPDSTKTETMYVPKHKTRAEISIDKKSKIYTIVRVVGAKTALSNYHNTVKISIDQNEKTNQNVNAEITLTEDDIELSANNIIISNNNGEKINLTEKQKIQEDQIQILIGENTMLKQKINAIEEKLDKS